MTVAWLNFIVQALRRELIDHYGDGSDAIRYVDDMIDAFIRLMVMVTISLAL